jgi:hypothetical protein
MTTSEVSGGLVLPYAAMTIAGKGGAAAVLLMTFMAVTSTLSAQVIAVSSILSFDVYREYFKKSATNRDLIRSSHFGVIFFAAFSAGFSTMLNYVGIDLGWTLYMLGQSNTDSQPEIATNRFCRGCYLPWDFPDGFHRPMASPEQSRSHPLAHTRSRDWTCRVAWNSVSFRGQGLCH